MGVSAPPFRKGSDSVTPAVALGDIDGDFFRPEDFEIACGGCTACCRGDDGPIINPDERFDYECHVDKKGNLRLDQVDGHCVYLEEGGCSIHDRAPRICRDFDCRSLILKFNNRGLDYMINSGQLPLEVVVEGRRQLKAFNHMIETRALTVGADLSSLLMVPAEEREDAPPDDAA